MSTISILGSILPARLMIDGFIGAWNGSNMEHSSKVDPTFFAEIRPPPTNTAVREQSIRTHNHVTLAIILAPIVYPIMDSHGWIRTRDQDYHFEMDGLLTMDRPHYGKI